MKKFIPCINELDSRITPSPTPVDILPPLISEPLSPEIILEKKITDAQLENLQNNLDTEILKYEEMIRRNVILQYEADIRAYERSLPEESYLDYLLRIMTPPVMPTSYPYP